MTSVSFTNDNVFQVFQVTTDLVQSDEGKKQILLLLSDIQNKLNKIIIQLIDYEINPTLDQEKTIITEISQLYTENQDNIILQQIFTYIKSNAKDFQASGVVMPIRVSITGLGRVGGNFVKWIGTAIQKCTNTICKVLGIGVGFNKLIQHYLDFINGHLTMVIYSVPMQTFLGNKMSSVGGAKKTKKTTRLAKDRKSASVAKDTSKKTSRNART
jgi:hypothetical protein